jgi:thymidylate synthase
MNNLDGQYQALLQYIINHGTEKRDRTGTGTISVFGRQIRHSMKDGFPLLTTKKMAFKTMATELIWFLRGDTSIEYLLKNDCNIWTGDAYKKYLKWAGYDPLNMEQFIERIKTDSDFAGVYGDLGPIYGKQWRKWKGKLVDKSVEFDAHTAWVPEQIDQIANLIRDLKNNPDSRRMVVSAWAVHDLPNMTLPPCHYGFQVYTRELSLEERFEITDKVNKEIRQDLYSYAFNNPIYTGGINQRPDDVERHECLNGLDIPTRAISLMWNQRSVDLALGWPFNVASYGLLLELLGKMVNMVPDELICNLGDVHLYNNHLEGAKEQISRTHYELPKLNINTEFWPTESGECGVGSVDALAVLKSFSDDNFCKCLLKEDIQLVNYQSHSKIYFPLSN